MSLINEKINQVNDENKKDNNPLSVRVDPYYKDLFEDVIKQKGIPKKALLESMIFKFVESENEDEKELNISFANEINLITGNLNEILNIFKTMTNKSQDTIGSQKSFYEQKLKNHETKNLIFENTCIELKEKIDCLEISNKSILHEKESINKTVSELNSKDFLREKEIKALHLKNAELIEQINILQKLEKENILLKIENEKCKHEINLLKASLESRNIDNEKLMKKASALDELFVEAKNKKVEDFKELELMIRKETELDKKMEILKLQVQYNELQTENLKNLRIINDKAEELLELKKTMKI